MAKRMKKKKNNNNNEGSPKNPLITINKQSLMDNFHPQNVVVLHDPEFDENNNVCFNSSSTYNNNNTTFEPKTLMKDGAEFKHGSFKLSYVETNKLIIVCSKDKFMNKVPARLKNPNFFTLVSVSNNSTNVSSDQFIIIAVLGNNPASDDNKENCVWTKTFVDQLKKHFKCNMKGIGDKHHGTFGEFHGIGLINKYKKDKEELSFGDFASTTSGDGT